VISSYRRVKSDAGKWTLTSGGFGSLGRSPLTGAQVFKPVAKGASISLDDVRRVVRDLEPLALD
jgi:hypothetical protein